MQPLPLVPAHEHPGCSCCCWAHLPAWRPPELGRARQMRHCCGPWRALLLLRLLLTHGSWRAAPASQNPCCWPLLTPAHERLPRCCCCCRVRLRVLHCARASAHCVGRSFCLPCCAWLTRWTAFFLRLRLRLRLRWRCGCGRIAVCLVQFVRSVLCCFLCARGGDCVVYSLLLLTFSAQELYLAPAVSPQYPPSTQQP